MSAAILSAVVCKRSRGRAWPAPSALSLLGCGGWGGGCVRQPSSLPFLQCLRTPLGGVPCTRELQACRVEAGARRTQGRASTSLPRIAREPSVHLPRGEREAPWRDRRRDRLPGHRRPSPQGVRPASSPPATLDMGHGALPAQNGASHKNAADSRRPPPPQAGERAQGPRPPSLHIQNRRISLAARG